VIFTDGGGTSGMKDCQVTESVCAAGIHREQPKRLWKAGILGRATTRGAQIVARVRQHALAGIFPNDARSHHDRPIGTVRNLVASDLNLAVSILTRG